MPGDPSLLSMALFALIVFVAGLAHGTLGLGFPLITTPLLALFMDVRSAILVTLLPTAAVNTASVLRGGEWQQSVGRYWPLAAYALAGSVAGTAFIIISDPRPFKMVLALLILLYLASERLGKLRMHWVAAHPAWSMPVFGLIAGLAAGSTNVMVPILIIFALESGLRANAMVQVFNLCFLAGKLSQIAMFAGAGLFDTDLLITTAPLAAVALVALWAGMTVRSRIPAETYRTLVKWVLLLLALILIVQYFWE